MPTRSSARSPRREAGAAQDRGGRPVGVVWRRRPPRHRDPHRATTRDTVPPAQHVPSRCTAAITARVRSSSPKRTSTWFSTTSLTISTSAAPRSRSAMRRARRQWRSTSSSSPARPASGSPHRPRSPGAPGRLRAPVAASWRASPPVTRYGASWRHRRRMRGGVGGDGEAGVVRDVEPLVAVDAPRVGALDPRGEVPPVAARPRPTGRRRRRHGPRPRARGRARRSRRSVSKAPVLTFAGLRAHDQRSVVVGEDRPRASARMRPWSSAGTMRMASVPKPRKRTARSIVLWRCSPTTIATGGAPSSPRPRRPSRLRRGRGGGRRRGTSMFAIWAPVVRPTPRAAGQVEELEQPPPATPCTALAAGDITCSMLFWSHARRQPVGSHRRGQRAPGDEPEVPAPAAGDEPGVDGRRQLGDDGRRRDRTVRQVVGDRHRGGRTGHHP